jgi:predicted esterase
LEFDGEEDEKGILESSSKVNSIIAEEVNNGIPPNRIVLGGFSQGGALSLFTGLTTNTKLGGLVILSAWLLMQEKVKSVRHSLYAAN